MCARVLMSDVWFSFRYMVTRGRHCPGSSHTSSCARPCAGCLLGPCSRVSGCYGHVPAAPFGCPSVLSFIHFIYFTLDAGPPRVTLRVPGMRVRPASPAPWRARASSRPLPLSGLSSSCFASTYDVRIFLLSHDSIPGFLWLWVKREDCPPQFCPSSPSSDF